MTDKHSFVLYDYIKKQIDELTDEERGQLFKAVLEYVTTGETPEMDRVLLMVFIGIRNDIDRSNAEWAKKRRAQSAGGRKGTSNRYGKKAEQDPDADLEQKKEKALALLWGSK